MLDAMPSHAGHGASQGSNRSPRAAATALALSCNHAGAVRWGAAASTAALAVTAWFCPCLAHAEPDPSPAVPEPSVASVLAPEAEPVEPVAVSDALGLDAGATCLEHDRLSEQIVSWLERDELDPRLTVVVEGHATEVRTLRFTLRDRGRVIAERAFAPGPSSCDDLHAVVALAIALAVDATVLESVGIASPPPAATPPPPEPEPTPAPVPEDLPPLAEPAPTLDLSPRPKSPWTLRAHAHGLLALAVPSALGGGAEVGVEASWRDRIDLQLGGLAAASSPQPVEGGTLSVALVAARADLCGGRSFGRVRPRGCVGALAGSALAQGRGFQIDGRITLPWLALAAGGDVRVGLGRWLALAFGFDAVIGVVRPAFAVREGSQVRHVRELPRLGGMLGMGVVVTLPRGPRASRGEGRPGIEP